MEGWKRVLRLRGSSSGPFVQVDEAAATASWMDGGKKMVRLLDGQVFEVLHTVDIPVPAAEAGGKIRFKSSDGVEFEMDRAAARKSPTIMFLVKTSRTDSIPIVEVKSKILEKVLDYCYKHVPRADGGGAANTDDGSAEELKSWDADFIKVDLDTLYHLIMAARYLEIQELKNLACQAVADIIKGKTPEEIRATFNIKKDMTPEEEEAAVRELHSWQRATSSLENMEQQTPEEARREWMDIVNSKFCTYYELDFY